MATTTQVVMPQLGESVTEGTIERWLKQPGDAVGRDEPLVEVITDKVNAEVSAPAAGTVSAIHVKAGETVKVGTLIAEIAGEGAETGAAAPAPAPQPAAATSPAPVAAAPAPAAAPPASVPAPAAAVNPSTSAAVSATAPQPGNGSAGGAVQKASPVVRRLAQEHNLDLGQIPGTGEGGRVTRNDVLAFIESGGTAAVAAPAATSAPASAPAAPAAAPAAAASPAPGVPSVAGDREERVPLSGLRRAIAANMTWAKQNVPHAWCVVEVEMSAIWNYRLASKDRFEKQEGVPLTFVPFALEAAVAALKEYPLLNAHLDGDEVVIKRYYNLGLAVSVPDGLLVPVIKDADRRSFAELAREAHRLADRARNRKLTLDEIEGCTFTVNNPGAFGSLLGYPVLVRNTSAIVSMEGVRKRPVVIDDAIAIRPMMNLCLSFDHRVLDGELALRFLHFIKTRLEGFKGL